MQRLCFAHPIISWTRYFDIALTTLLTSESMHAETMKNGADRKGDATLADIMRVCSRMKVPSAAVSTLSLYHSSL